MTQLEYLKEFPPIDHCASNRTIFAAFVNCLGSEDSCELLISIYQDHIKRRIVLRKVCQDVINGLKPHHEKLLSTFEEQSNSMTYHEKIKRASTLLYMFDVLPDWHKERLIERYLNYKSTPIRERVYKKLDDKWDERYIPLIEQAWNDWYDVKCATIIIKHFKIKQILERLDELLQVLDSSHYQGLFKRIALEAPEKLQELKRYDEIAFVYALTKVEKCISEEQAWAIFKNNIGNKRRDLLIWCYGKMKLWGVLKNIYDHYEELVMEDFAKHNNIQK